MKNLLGLNRITPRAINANAVSGQSHSNKCIFIWTVLLEKLNRGICSLSPPPDHPNSPHNGKERRAEQSWTFLKRIWSDVMIPLCINYQWNQPICCVNHRCIHGHPFYFGNRLNVLLFKLIAFEKFRAGLETGWWGRGLWTHTRVCKSVLKWTRGDTQRSEPKRQGFESYLELSGTACFGASPVTSFCLTVPVHKLGTVIITHKELVRVKMT